jgi:MSHA biogenesis protein MshP
MTRLARLSGSAIISALFLVIVLGALGAAMVNLSIVQQDTATKSLLASRVYYGAKTGLEWGIQRTISDPAPPAICTGVSFPATFLPSGAGLANVSVTVTCARSQHGAGTAVFTYYITSIAKTGTLGTLSYAERHMEATVSNIP